MAETKKNKTIHQKFLQFQMEVEGLKKDKTNPFFGSKYFDINGILANVKPKLNELGLFLTQGLTTIESTGKLGIATTIFDADSGEHLGWIAPLPETADAQKAGSAITYFRRYALQSLLGLEAEDDDANLASQKPLTPILKPVTIASPKAKTARVIKKAKVKIDEDLPPFGTGSGKNEDVLSDDVLDE